eukprot:m.24072 g.24072  ORF g.24072 m.24072 type:complete len:94 (+) comp5612_c0_seq1:2688-2969(+)
MSAAVQSLSNLIATQTRGDSCSSVTVGEVNKMFQAKPDEPCSTSSKSTVDQDTETRHVPSLWGEFTFNRAEDEESQRSHSASDTEKRFIFLFL